MKSEEFEKYQHFTEQTIFELSQQVITLEKKLNMFTNLLEISKYINQYIKDPNLFPLINDMLIGVFGAKFSNIYIKLNDEYFEASTKEEISVSLEDEKQLILNNNEEEFIINSDVPIYSSNKSCECVHSCLGVPIKVNSRLIGFILIQHQEKDFFTKDHAVFLSSLGNHIGVAIENNLLYNHIRESAYLDGLTGIFNKRYFFEVLNANPKLDELKYSIVMVDLDNFKTVNDTYGHPFGDVVLKKVAGIINTTIRPNDIVARYGGEEIIVFLSNFSDKDKVLRRIEIIRKEIEETMIEDEGVSASVTASFGVYCKGDEKITLDDVIKRADENLYLSKRNGKNKITLSC